jgi:hypothetical protein
LVYRRQNKACIIVTQLLNFPYAKPPDGNRDLVLDDADRDGRDSDRLSGRVFEGRMTITEISAWYIAYRKAIRMAQAEPDILVYQYMAAKAYAALVTAQAQYKMEVTL